eukprot:gb/GECG01006968.1/.p1 GENE.gb/GECG01006968.1/~~gb/GECG01006968.1/.p1  ORF type:complete len:284 (+),score=39.97 gb/GECG01006968.1/:1-852(+)
MLVRHSCRLTARSSRNGLGTLRRGIITISTIDTAPCRRFSIPTHGATCNSYKPPQLGRTRLFHATQQSLEAVTMNVPQMGDSITEGTINEILKKPGEYVQQDEVLVSIETDKVNVEVRAEHAGVISEYHCQEGDDVAVGSKLVTVDTNASSSEAKPAADSSSGAKKQDTATSEQTSPPPSSEEASKISAPNESTSSQQQNRGHTPLIQFRHGKENREKLQPEKPEHTSVATTGAPAQSFEKRLEENFPSKADKNQFELPSMYGRPPISDEEAEAIELGMRINE